MPPGTRLGPYEIVSPLGAGGMGEVFLARDTRLERRVAIKTLPRQFAVDDERARRFTREAQVASAINHPNVAAIYDVGESGDVRFIAWSSSRRTLAERIAAGPMRMLAGHTAYRTVVMVSECPLRVACFGASLWR